MSCSTCGDSGWLCEDHPDQPHPHAGCGALGRPCPDCNTDERPPVGWTTVAPFEGDPADLGLPVTCPHCGAAADYVRTDPGPTHVFSCPRHGRLILAPDGRVRQQPS
jgi:hypothetical protein